ncbi:MAG: GHKL domain-containing protein [Gammaproteobacteria bacterium]|nr:GHKL domain-containing protein [Gammaproteobacteria bacterium]
MTSIRRRLQLSLTTSILLVLLLFGIGQAILVERLMHDLITTRLQDESESLLSALAWDAQGRLSVDGNKIGSLYQRPYSGHYYVIQSGEQRVASRSLWEGKLALKPSDAAYEIEGPLQQYLLIQHRTYRKQGRDISLWLAEDMNPHYAPLKTYYLIFALVSLLALLLLWAWQTRIIANGLKPLAVVTRALARFKRGELQNMDEAVPDEIGPLVREVNHLTALLQQRIERSHHALGNLSHALKTPLTLLQQLAEQDIWRHYPREHELMQQQLQQVRRRVDEELRRARIVGGSHPAQGFNPAVDLPALVETVRQVHRDKPVAIGCDAVDQLCPALSRDDMMELFGNLLDNAVKWANQQVHCQVLSDEGAIRIEIEDDGPGVEVPQELLSKRGSRLDEQVSGHGLGLAISSDIVEAYHGTLQFKESASLGGLQVEISLPLTDIN